MSTTVNVANVSSNTDKALQVAVTNPGDAAPTVSTLNAGQNTQVMASTGTAIALSEIDLAPPAPPPAPTIASVASELVDLTNKLVALAATAATPPA